MLSNKIKKILKEVLTDKQIKVYMAAMKGPCSVQELAQRSDIDRVQTYQIVKDLCATGLLVQEVKKHGRTIIAEHPKKLVNLLGNRQRKIRRDELKLQNLLPEILSEFNQGLIKPKVKYYEGLDGIYSIYYDALKYPKVLEVISIETDLKIETNKEKLNKFTKELNMTNCEWREILEYTKTSKEYAQTRNNYKSLVRFLPAVQKIQTSILIYADKRTVFVNLPNLHAVLIEDKKIHDTQKMLLENLWNSLPPI